MADPKNPRSGGVFIALGAGVGLALGVAGGQPTTGLLLGIAAGAALALLLFLRDRR